MASRKMVRLSKLHTRVNTADLQGDWVTIGVIINKSEPRMSSKVGGNSNCLYMFPFLDV